MKNNNTWNYKTILMLIGCITLGHLLTLLSIFKIELHMPHDIVSIQRYSDIKDKENQCKFDNPLPCHLSIGQEVVVGGCGWDFLGDIALYEDYEHIYLLGYDIDRSCAYGYSSEKMLNEVAGIDKAKLQKWIETGYTSFCFYQRGRDF